MGYADRSTNDVGNGEYFVDRRGRHIEVKAFTQMVLYTVVASEHHRSYQAKQLLGFFRQCAMLIGLSIQTEKSV